MNYFENIENSVDEFIEKYDFEYHPPVSNDRLLDIFVDKYGFAVEESGFEKYKEMAAFRSEPTLAMPGSDHKGPKACQTASGRKSP